MWLVPSRRQWMLTQGPTPDPKFKLNISSFLTHSHPLYCLICAKNIMIIFLLLQMIGDGKVGGASFMFGFGRGTGGWLLYHSLLLFCHFFLVSLFLLPLFTSITLPHLCQEYHDHFFVTANDRGWQGWDASFMFGFGRGTGGGYYIFFYFFVLLLCCF